MTQLELSTFEDTLRDEGEVAEIRNLGRSTIDRLSITVEGKE